MLKAMAREVGHAADAVAGAAGAAVSAVLPGKSSEETDNAPAGVAEDEDVQKSGNDRAQGKEQPKESKKDEGKMSVDASTDKADQEEQQETTPAAQQEEGPTADMAMEGAATEVEARTQVSAKQQQQEPEPEPAAEDKAEDAASPEPKSQPAKADKASKTASKHAGGARKTPAAAPTSQQQQQQQDKAELVRLAMQEQQTAGAAPLPKMSKGRASWMRSKSAWYPDRSGIQHPPGVFINRRPPFKGWGAPPAYTDVQELLGK